MVVTQESCGGYAYRVHQLLYAFLVFLGSFFHFFHLLFKLGNLLGRAWAVRVILLQFSYLPRD